jgi:hypothetical protein
LVPFSALSPNVSIRVKFSIRQEPEREGLVCPAADAVLDVADDGPVLAQAGVTDEIGIAYRGRSGVGIAEAPRFVFCENTMTNVFGKRR